MSSLEAGSPEGEASGTDVEPPATPDEPKTSEAPPEAPPPEAAPSPLSTAERDQLLTEGARSLVLAALLGAAFAVWTQIAFRSPWLDEFVIDNEIEPALRRQIIIVTVLGATLGGLVCVGVGYWLRRLGKTLTSLEHWLWFLAPLMLLPLAPILFRSKAWVSRHEELLPLLVLVILVLETLVVRSLLHAPGAAREWWAEVRAQVPALVRRRGPLVLVIAAALAYAAFFIFFTLRWHYKLRTGNYDLSINNNLMFGGLHGRFLESPVVFPKNPPQYLANHAKFGAYLFLPVYALFPRAETLLVIQSLFIGLGAVPLFLFGRRYVSEWMAAVVALAYLCYYPLHGASFSEFQAIPVTAFFVFLAAWAADSKRYGVLAGAVAVALLMREDVAIGLAVLGGFLLLSGHRPLPGLFIAGSAVSYFLVLRFYVMEEAGSWWFPNMYKELWADGEKGFRSVIRTLISNPTFALSKIISEKQLFYLLHLLVPVAFVPARRWYLWAAFLPGAMLTLIVTNYSPPVTYSFHYVMHWAPYVFLAVMVFLGRIASERSDGAIRARAAAAAVVAASLVLTYNYGAFPQRQGSFKGGFSRIEFTFSDEERERYRNLMEIIKSLPPDASVAATEKVGPHVSSRLFIYTMRHGPQTAEYILASSRELKLSKTKPNLKEAVKSGTFGVIRRVADFALLRRGAPTDQNEELMRDWGL